MPDDNEIQIDKLTVLEREELTLTDETMVRVSRRRKVDETLEYESVSALVVPEGTDKTRYDEIVIHENLKRPNLQWYEIVELEKRLHDMRQVKHGKGRKGLRNNTGWTLRDTAAELEMGLGTLSQDLRLADAIRVDPNLLKIKDKQTALRLVMQTARRIEAEVEAQAPSKIEHNQVLCGDASEVLKFFPDNTFDVCFTDPPWLEYKDERLTKDDRTVLVFKELYRVMKMGSFLYAIVSTPDFIEYQRVLPTFGWSVQRTPLIWNKLNVISHGLRAWEYARDFEPILLAVKGNPALTQRAQISSIYTSPALHVSKLIHPNEKPVDVPMHFLSHCTYEGSLVVDPFGGSGVTAEACVRMGRHYITIERDKAFYEGISRRLSNLVGREISGDDQPKAQGGV